MPEYSVGAYVKLAKWWERKRTEAVSYHKDYYTVKFSNNPNMKLCGVFIDITGNKEIWKRPQMIQLLLECKYGHINCIATQTKAYLAANTEDLFFLLHYLFGLKNRIDIVTEDPQYNINTIVNAESQRENLIAVASKYASVESERYVSWMNDLTNAMDEMENRNG